MISSVKGCEDILDLHFQNFVINTIKQHLLCYNFSEIQTPILEYTNLFARTLGIETDVVTKEMYTFTTKGGEEICLRPEATAPTIRAFLQNKVQQTPWKVFSYGPMFRHERPQKGRWRQFSQFNAEVIGASNIANDAQMIKIFDHLFSERFGLNSYVLHLNFLGTREERKNYTLKLHAFLNRIEDKLCDTCRARKETNILRIFDCKNEQCRSLYGEAPKISSHLETESQKEWEKLRDMLEMLSVTFVHNSSLVRGLDYYNKTVFEFTSADLGAQNAFCAGGRYDSLATQLGSKQDYPSIGAAIGIGRLLLLLEKIKKTLPIPQKTALNLIVPMNEDLHMLALLLAYDLQSHDICVDVLLEKGSLKSLMRKTNKMGAQHVLIVGEDEQKDGTVTIKNMQTSKSTKVKQAEAALFLKGQFPNK